MKLYVACLASYNNGVLHGRWIDASTDVDAMQAEISAMLRESRFPNVMVDGGPSAEEWAIHDHEGLGDLGEYAGLQEVARRVAIVELAEERDIPAPVILEYARDYLSDADDIADSLDDDFAGKADSWADFAENLTRETHDMSAVPDWLANHIDWKSMGRDFELGGDWTAYEFEGENFFFWNH